MNTTTIDFLHPQRTPKLGWCLLAVGVLALMAAFWFDHQWAGERAEREAGARLREETAQRAQQAALRTRTPTPDQRRLQGIASQLRQPWLHVLRLIENVTEAPVFLLGLSIDPATGVLRLDGEAPSFDHVVAYAQVLDDEGVLGPAQLRSHELVDEPGSGQPSVRFSIMTRWRAR